MTGITLVWALLVAATLASYAVGHGAMVSDGFALTAVIGIAVAKVRMVFRTFMEIGHAPIAWRRATDIWLLVCGAGILLAFAGWLPLAE